MLADPDVGGRYSALTAFGLMPSLLAGADVERLLDRRAEVLARLARQDEDNPALALGAALGAAATAGRDKLVLADAGSGIVGLGDWAEQLIAESTGKQGKGILPVVVEGADAPGLRRRPTATPTASCVGPGTGAGLDAASVNRVARRAVPALGVRHRGRRAVLGINPFDQPNVTESKENTKKILDDAGDGAAARGRAGARRRRRRGVRRPRGARRADRLADVLRGAARRRSPTTATWP